MLTALRNLMLMAASPSPVRSPSPELSPSPSPSASPQEFALLVNGFGILGYREGRGVRFVPLAGNPPPFQATERGIELELEPPPGSRPITFEVAAQTLTLMRNVCPALRIATISGVVARFAVPWAPIAPDGRAYCVFVLPGDAAGELTVSQTGGEPRPLPRLPD